MPNISREIEEFRLRAQRETAAAGARAALQLSCGIDLDAALSAGGEERRRLAAEISRRLHRERLKGLNRHWSYDLNRHIALKHALERIRPERHRAQKRAAKAAPF